MTHGFDHVFKIGRPSSGGGVLGILPPPRQELIKELVEMPTVVELGVVLEPAPFYEIFFDAPDDKARVDVACDMARLLAMAGFRVGVDTHLTDVAEGANVLQAHEYDAAHGCRAAGSAVLALAELEESLMEF